MTPRAWPPAIILAVGALLATVGVRAQRAIELRAPLESVVSDSIAGYTSPRNDTLSTDERNVVGVTSYLARTYLPHDTSAGERAFTLYIGYYDRQTQGKSVHSPKNCLPGSGWEPLTSSVASIDTEHGAVTVNRYLLQKGNQRALVLYWYQGRGRVASNEYRVKLDLLRDAAIRHRSEEALVRIVVHYRTDEAAAFRLAQQVARTLVPAIYTALPT